MTDELKGLLDKCINLPIYESYILAKQKVERYEKIVVSVSGGSDSDIMLDIIARLDEDYKKVKYVFFDTGIEYQATKKHLDHLENKYGITIERMRANVPVPLGCRKYGLPFWSKYVSEMIERLQRCNFKWEDRPFEELVKEYPKCSSALKWWCNKWKKSDDRFEKSRFNIDYIRGLKEFMIENPPNFKISSKCCNGAKKSNAKDYCESIGADLSMVGVRKAEGGIRAVAYKTCFDNAKDGQTWDNYRPIFWYSDKDKKEYEELFGVTHSDCYTKYGFKRTGCAGCPFAKDFYKELEIVKEYEPKLYKAINNIFGESYEYTRRFLEFRKALFVANGVQCKQMTIFEMEGDG